MYIKPRFRQVHLNDAAGIAGLSAETLAGHLFVDVDNDYLYYVATDGTPTVILDGGGGGATDLSIGTKSATTLDIDSSTGTSATIPSATGTTAGLQAAADKSKLDGIETGATANLSNSDLLDRANHSGSQAISTVTGLQTALDGKAATSHTHTASDITDFALEVSNNTNVSLNTTHRTNTANPHNTDIGNLGNGTLAELNNIITDATLDDDGDSRPPTTSTGIISHFQVFDDGTTTQATTTTPTVVTNLWASADISTSDITFTDSTGRATFNTAGTAVIDAKAVTYQTANNRHELHIRILHWNGSTLNIYDESANYASRNTTQREGDATIPGLKIEVGVNDYIVMAVYHIGVAGTLGAAQVAGQTRISITLFK